MTDEEMAEEYAGKKCCNAELEKENEDLKKNLARYSEKIYEQEAQIEKMKRCNNCEFENYEKYHGVN